MMTMLQKVLTF